MDKDLQSIQEARDLLGRAKEAQLLLRASRRIKVERLSKRWLMQVSVQPKDSQRWRQRKPALGKRQIKTKK